MCKTPGADLAIGRLGYDLHIYITSGEIHAPHRYPASKIYWSYLHKLSGQINLYGEKYISIEYSKNWGLQPP